jgi:potassium-transporting ATPase ATP-binding subunit
MSKQAPAEIGLFAPEILRPAVRQAFVKLNPKGLARNPVIFATALVSVFATILTVRAGIISGPTFWIGQQITIWLWFTVLFANFAEAVAEGRGEARADAFRATKTSNKAKLLLDPSNRVLFEMKDVELIEPGETIVVEAGDIILTDGEIIDGVASVDESAITGGSPSISRRSSARCGMTSPAPSTGTNSSSTYRRDFRRLASIQC